MVLPISGIYVMTMSPSYTLSPKILPLINQLGAYVATPPPLTVFQLEYRMSGHWP